VRLSGKLSEADLVDVRRIVRPKMYWPKLILANWYGVLLLGVFAWATIAGLAGKTQPNWTGLVAIWGVIISIFAWNFYRTKQSMAREFQQLNAGLPDWLALENSGVKSEGPNGAAAFQPWPNFKGWREGSRVILLDLDSDAFMILPVAERLSAERDSIRQLLISRFKHPTEQSHGNCR
jgi:hypothetical protein